jgi:hypothetical protein
MAAARAANGAPRGLLAALAAALLLAAAIFLSGGDRQDGGLFTPSALSPAVAADAVVGQPLPRFLRPEPSPPLAVSRGDAPGAAPQAERGAWIPAPHSDTLQRR